MRYFTLELRPLPPLPPVKEETALKYIRECEGSSDIYRQRELLSSTLSKPVSSRSGCSEEQVKRPQRSNKLTPPSRVTGNHNNKNNNNNNNNKGYISSKAKNKRRFRRIRYFPPELRPHPPLPPDKEETALKYIRECEGKQNKHIFLDFEQQISDHIKNRDMEKAFCHTFVEYVWLDVTYRNEYRELPLGNWLLVALMRLECKYIHGVTPQYHAAIYINRINECMEEHGKDLCMRLYMNPEFRRRSSRSRRRWP